MKHKLPPRWVLPVVLAGFLAFVAREQLSTLWSGQTASSPTNVSLTVIGTSSSSAASSASSSTAAASSAAQSSVSSDPHGWHHYSEEETMKRLIPLLRRRFLRPVAPVIPPQVIPPYYKPITTFPRTRIPSERDLLNFGKQLQSDVESFLTWPFGSPVQEAQKPLRFYPWGPFDPWQWEETALSPEGPDVQQGHAAAGEPRWTWVQYISNLLGPRAEPWLWGFFITVMTLIILFWRRLSDKVVNILILIHRHTQHHFATYEGPPTHEMFVTDEKN